MYGESHRGNSVQSLLSSQHFCWYHRYVIHCTLLSHRDDRGASSRHGYSPTLLVLDGRDCYIGRVDFYQTRIGLYPLSIIWLLRVCPFIFGPCHVLIIIAKLL